jgi:hypothetical protein
MRQSRPASKVFPQGGKIESTGKLRNEGGLRSKRIVLFLRVPRALNPFYHGNRLEPAALLPSGAFPAMGVRPRPLADSVLKASPS